MLAEKLNYQLLKDELIKYGMSLVDESVEGNGCVAIFKSDTLVLIMGEPEADHPYACGYLTADHASVFVKWATCPLRIYYFDEWWTSVRDWLNLLSTSEAATVSDNCGVFRWDTNEE